MAEAALGVVELVAAITHFCCQPVRERGPEVAADMAEVQRGKDMIDLKLSEMAAAFAATDEYDEQGSVSPIHWIRHNLHIGGGAAADRVAVGEHLKSLPESHETYATHDRKRDKRLADALVEVANRTLDTGSLPQRGSQRPHLQVTTTLETLLQRAGASAADVEFSLPISAKAVERLACDCNVTRILLGADSVVIDVGRSKRVISASQRPALKVRDDGCRFPGCDRPVTWTSGHHLIHWSRGGRSDLPNIVLLCYRHHWMVHEGKWQLVKTDDGNMHAIPPQLGLFAAARSPGNQVA